MTYKYSEAYKIVEDAKDAMRNHYDFRIGDFSFVYSRFNNNYIVAEIGHPKIILCGNFCLEINAEFEREEKLKGYAICVQLGYTTGDHAFIHIEGGEFVCY